jgi:hypothetical protein
MVSWMYSPGAIRRHLNKAVSYVCSSIGCYSRSPATDFTRRRKLPADELMNLLIRLQSKSLISEISDYFTDLDIPPSVSAVIQQRRKLDPEALHRVLRLFTDSIHASSLFHGYRLLAADGSSINIPYNAEDRETYCIQKGMIRGFNQLHLNALYDVLNNCYVDIEIDTHAKSNEPSASEKMLESNGRNFGKFIYLADRGYEKYGLIAFLIENDMKFIIRVKDISSNGILSTMKLDDKEFDLDLEKIITRRQTKDVKDHPEKYVRLMTNQTFRYLPVEEESYHLKFRAVRFRISDDTCECLITNLPRNSFPIQVIKELYEKRWGIEGGFRELKYTIGLTGFHGKSRQFLYQEIYARTIMYNLCQFIVAGTPPDKSDTKYSYKINFTSAVTNIRQYLAGVIDEERLILRIKKFLTPVRSGRSFARNIRPQSAKSFTYRSA